MHGSHKKAKAQHLHCITNARARMGRTTRLTFVVLCAFWDLARSYLDNVLTQKNSEHCLAA